MEKKKKHNRNDARPGVTSREKKKSEERGGRETNNTKTIGVALQPDLEMKRDTFARV